MSNIAIIGVGAIGKRHLDSILKSDKIQEIFLVDRNKEVVAHATDLDSKRIVAGTDCSILPGQIDVAIIATTSAVRKKVFQELVAKSNVKNIIFEKVLFQRKEDYLEVKKILGEKKIKAWVNCARREYASYIDLKNILNSVNNFTCSITGGNWGLGCNGIHMLDLVQYLAGEKNLKVNHVDLLPVVEESKRGGYKEVYGDIVGDCGRCINFSISCFRDSSLPVIIEIAADCFWYCIIESKQKMYYMIPDNDWKVKEKDFFVPYQSQLTQKIIESILVTGECNLAKYEESMRLHLKFINPLIEFFENYGIEKGLCPIT